MQIVLLKKNENGEFQKLTEVLPNGMIPNNCILHKRSGRDILGDKGRSSLYHYRTKRSPDHHQDERPETQER